MNPIKARWNRLGVRLTFFFLLLAIVPMLGVGALAYITARSALEQDVINRLTTINLLKDSEFHRWNVDNKELLRSLAQRPLVRAYAASLVALDEYADPAFEDLHRILIDDHLQPALTSERGFRDLSLIRTSDGLILASTNESLENKYRESEEFFIQGQRGTYIQQPRFSLTESETVMHVSTPVMDSRGQVVAVLVGHADLDDMSSILTQRSGMSASEETYLVNRSNLLITESRFDAEAALRKSIFTQGVSNCLAGHEGSRFYDDYRGVQVVGVYHWMDEWGLCILTKEDQAEAFTAIDTLNTAILSASAVAVVVSLLLGLSVTRSITQPLSQVVKGAGEIGRGNLDYRIEIKGSDEISLLARAFNQMTAGLQLITASRDELDKEVTNRKQAQEELIKERDKAQQYLDVAGTIFVVIDADEKVTLINKTGCRMLGAEEDEIVGQNWFDTYIPERNRREIRAVYKLLMAGETEPTEYYENTVLTKDGSERIIAWHNTLLVDEEGKIQGTLSSGEDISERREAEGKLRIKDFAFESSSSADSIGSNDGFLTHANPAFAWLWGYENVNEVIGKPILDFIADKDEAQEIVESITNTGKWSGEYTALKKDGSTFIALSYANAVQDAEGNQTALYSSVVDVTDRKKAEIEIQKLNEELEQRVLQRTAQLEAANEELEAFAYSVSHDLRSPLRAIDGFSRILMDEHLSDLPSEAQRYLNLVRNNTRDMDKLIDNLLAFSRLARQELATQRVSPNKIVKLALAELEGDMEGRAVELTIADLPDCQADPSLIKLIYTNLLDNALKFTRGRDPALIEVGHLELDGEQVYFVKDNGVGFDMQYADNLFGVFQRLHRAEEFEGTGVGLANVQRIIRRHGGRVWAEAEVDQGATFYFACGGEIHDE